MNRRQLKRLVTSSLHEKELVESKRQLFSFDQKSLINPLVSCLCHIDETVRWHSVTVIGEVVNSIAMKKIEDARIVMRRFLWMLNDESGGIGWGVPEAMAESMYHNKILADEYLHMLVSYTRDDGTELFQDGNFLELPLIQQGVLWGICRLAGTYKRQLIHLKANENVGFYMGSGNSQVRGLACQLSGQLSLNEHEVQLQALISDQGKVRIYQDGRLKDYTVGELALSAVQSLNNRNQSG